LGHSITLVCVSNQVSLSYQPGYVSIQFDNQSTNWLIQFYGTNYRNMEQAGWPNCISILTMQL